MANFSASDVALTGFRIVRERPRVVAIWAAIQFVISLGFSLGMVSLAGPALASLSAGGASASRDPAQAVAMVRQLAPFYALLVLFSLAFYPVLYATMNRAVLRPSEEGLGYIRLGADELRQLGLLLLIVLFVVVAYIALIIALVAIVAATGAVTRGGGAGTSLIGLLAVLVGLAAICAWIYVWVRLSLASAQTFATRRINLFGSWALTRGQFWPMFGAYVVALILAIVVSLLAGVISLAVGAVLGGGVGGLSALFQPNMTSVAAYLTPARLVQLVIGAASNALVLPVLFTPAAAIYRSLPGSLGEMEAASAFD